MSANYWLSTQSLEWEDHTAESTDTFRNDEDRALAARFPLPEPRLLYAFFQRRLHQLGKKLGVRQIVLATAMVYIRRFYQKVQIRQTNPYLLLATALYVSTKIEECPQHIKVVLSAARSIWPGYIQPDVAKLGECEFRLVSEMNAQLIVYHPYRYLVQMQGQLELSADAMTTAWKVVNDHYLTDLLFRIPPPVIAAIAIVLTVIPGSHRAGAEENTRQDSQEDDADPEAKADTRQEADQAEASVQVSDRLQSWLGSSEYDVETVMEGVQQMISLYVIWEGSPQSDDQCKEQIARFIRGRLEAWAGNM